MNIFPTKLDMPESSELRITWSDDTVRTYDVEQLRADCPCASCREKRKTEQPQELLPVLTPAEAQPISITGMRPVGNYAYCMQFSDGHDTGIFTLEALLELGDVVK